MVAISELFSLLGSSKSKVLILSTGAECSDSVPAFFRSLISEHVSTEALLLAEARRQTSLGGALRSAQKSGGAPAEENILAVLRRWFFSRRADSGFRLAGFPRTRLQALVFEEWLESRAEELDACLWVPNTPAVCSSVIDFYRERGLLVAIDEPAAHALSES